MSETVATPSLLRTSRRVDATPGADKSRHFFTGLGAWCIVLALLGFGPHVGGSLRGAIVIPPAVHVHAAVMMAWLVLYGGQAWLAARGNLGRHRRVGWAAMALALTVWISMGVATVVALRRFDPDAFAFLVKPLLIQLGTMVVFPIFVGWAVLVRHRTGWHQRLMTFANFSLVQAALDRMQLAAERRAADVLALGVASLRPADPAAGGLRHACRYDACIRRRWWERA